MIGGRTLTRGQALVLAITVAASEPLGLREYLRVLLDMPVTKVFPDALAKLLDGACVAKGPYWARDRCLPP